MKKIEVAGVALALFGGGYTLGEVFQLLGLGRFGIVLIRQLCGGYLLFRFCRRGLGSAFVTCGGGGGCNLGSRGISGSRSYFGYGIVFAYALSAAYQQQSRCGEGGEFYTFHRMTFL